MRVRRPAMRWGHGVATSAADACPARGTAVGRGASAPGQPGDRPDLWGAVPSLLPGSCPACPWLEPPATAPARRRAQRGAHPGLAAAGLATDQKGARRSGRAVAFLDETGHTFQARVETTWAPTGQPPVLRRLSQRREASSLAALVAPLDGPARLYARHFRGSIQGEQVI